MCQLIWANELQQAEREQRVPTVLCRCKNGNHDRWDLVRYEVEREYGLLRDGATKGADSCLLGIRLCDVNRPPAEVYVLGEDVQIQLVGPVVLLRFPVPLVHGRYRPNTFIPNKIRDALARADFDKKEEARRAAVAQRLAQAQSEEARLAILLECSPGAPLQTHFPPKYPHPSASIAQSRYAGYINYNGEFKPWDQRPPPPAHWQCQRCFNYFEDPHYADQCPSLEIAAWVPMNRRLRPIGRPKSTLRPVDWDNVADVAVAPFIDDMGELWALK